MTAKKRLSEAIDCYMPENILSIIVTVYSTLNETRYRMKQLPRISDVAKAAVGSQACTLDWRYPPP